MSVERMTDDEIIQQQNAIKLETMESQLRKAIEETKQYKLKYDNCSQEVF